MSAWALASHFKVVTSKLFMLWARHCQASYPVRGQQAMFNAVVCVKGAVGLANSVDPGQTAPEGAV